MNYKVMLLKMAMAWFFLRYYSRMVAPYDTLHMSLMQYHFDNTLGCLQLILHHYML
jgi:hypothetical protein